MRRTDRVIITCAITGGIHTPSMSPYLPITPAQIAAESVAAAEAGAAMIHLHARDPKTGKPDQTPERFLEFLPQIKRQTDAIINITTGGGLGMTLDQRLAPALRVAPEVASMNMGSFNFNISAAAEKRSDWRFDWERPYLEASRDLILSNTFTQIERGMRELGGPRHALRVRMLRRGAPLQSRPFRRSGLGKAPVLRSVHFRDYRRHWPRSREPLAHARHLGSAFRQRLPSVGARCRTASAALRHIERHPRRERASRVGGQLVRRQGQARHLERGAGGEDSPYSGGTEPGGCNANRGARDAWHEGSRQRKFLIPRAAGQSRAAG